MERPQIKQEERETEGVSNESSSQQISYSFIQPNVLVLYCTRVLKAVTEYLAENTFFFQMLSVTVTRHVTPTIPALRMCLALKYLHRF